MFRVFFRYLESTMCFISSARLLLHTIQYGSQYGNQMMNTTNLSTHCFAHLAVLSFEIVFD